MERPNLYAVLATFCTFCLLQAAACNAFADPIRETVVATGESEQRPHVAYELGNGLKILLVSDADAQHGAVALTVLAGREDDPRALLGLSHLVEHILLKGGPLNACMKKLGGRANAERRHTSTEYFLVVPNTAIKSAIKCLARNFSNVRIGKKPLEREVAAIESEFQAQRKNKPRETDVAAIKHAVNPSHPYHGSFTGNKASLAMDSGQLARALEAFIAEHYVPSQMAVAIVANQTIDELKNAVAAFAKLEGPEPAATTRPSLITQSKVVRYRPIDGSARLAIAVPQANSEERAAAREYVHSLLVRDHEGAVDPVE